MKICVVIAWIFCCFTALAEDVHPAPTGFNLIAVTLDGHVARFLVPFPTNIGNAGKRMWEAIAEPYNVPTKDRSKTRDVNLFSLCHIKIAVETSGQNKAHLKLDFTEMKIPSTIAITKEDIISALLYCILDNQAASSREKPSITLLGRPEDKALLEKAEQEYEKTDYGGEISLVKEVPFAQPKETLHESYDAIRSSDVVADVSNNANGRIVIRYLKFKDPNKYNRGCYRFEFYSAGVLENCESHPDDEPGEVKVTWTDNDNCSISLLNGWLLVTFHRTQYPHWNIGRRID